MATGDPTDLRDRIARLEARLDELAAAAERTRKAILLSKTAMAGGGLLMLGLVAGLIDTQPLPIVMAIAAVVGGVVGFGANVSTAAQERSAMLAAAAARTALIGQLDLRDVGERVPRTLDLSTPSLRK